MVLNVVRELGLCWSVSVLLNKAVVRSCAAFLPLLLSKDELTFVLS